MGRKVGAKSCWRILTDWKDWARRISSYDTNCVGGIKMKTKKPNSEAQVAFWILFCPLESDNLQAALGKWHDRLISWVLNDNKKSSGSSCINALSPCQARRRRYQRCPGLLATYVRTQLHLAQIIETLPLSEKADTILLVCLISSMREIPNLHLILKCAVYISKSASDEKIASNYSRNIWVVFNQLQIRT